ncbi:MAG: tripartite tricarboxylate transporter TctB family protein [Rhizobiaceae bacterium]
MTSNRMQHLVPAFIILGLATIVTWLSFTQQPAEAFLFPRIIAVVFMLLAVWNFIRAATGLARVGRGIEKQDAVNLLPGLIVMLVLVFWAAKALGFYVSSTIAFFVVYSLYDPASYSGAKDWLKRAVITAAFMGVIYTLFALVLQVQTPRGIFL